MQRGLEEQEPPRGTDGALERDTKPLGSRRLTQSHTPTFTVAKASWWPHTGREGGVCALPCPAEPPVAATPWAAHLSRGLPRHRPAFPWESLMSY